MLKRHLSVYWFFQIGILLACGAIFLFVNIVPRAKIEPLHHIDGEWQNESTGELFYGWPKTTHIATITQSANHEEYVSFGYSVRHFWGFENFKLVMTERSEFAILANVQLLVSSLILVAMGVHCILKRRFSVRMLLATIALVAIASSSVVWDCSL